jgi:type VI secretion system secreted protein Hcp
MGGKVFMKVAGIPGECADAPYQDWIELLGFTHSLNLGGGDPPGPCLHDLSVNKLMDRSSPLLARACSDGRHFEEVVIVTRRGDCERRPILEVRLRDVVLTSYVTSATSEGGPDAPYDSFSLKAQSVQWRYFPEKAEDGSGAVEATWNVEGERPARRRG